MYQFASEQLPRQMYGTKELHLLCWLGDLLSWYILQSGRQILKGIKYTLWCGILITTWILLF